MAKRQTDVNINYKVNTVDVERGNGLLVRASKATDDLKKTTDTYGKQAAGAYKFASRSIEGMSIEVARLKMQVRLASTQNSADIQKLSAQYRSAKTQLDQYNKSLIETSRASKQAASAAGGMAAQLGDVYSSIRLLLTAGLVKELYDMTLAMATMAGKIEGVSIAFNKLPNAASLLHSLQKATHGTVSDLELMQKALRANNFRIPLENLGTLFEFAATKAQQTGQEVNHLVEYIVSGIGYRSIKRLDDLGFTANRVKGALGDVSLQAASMGEIMDAVTKLMNEDMQETGGYIQTSATKVEQLTKNLTDLRTEFSKQAESGGFIDMLNKAVDALTLYVKAGGFRDVSMHVHLEEMNQLAQEQVDLFKEGIKASKDKGKATEDEIMELDLLAESYRDTIAANEASIKSMKDEVEVLKERNKSWIGLQMPAGPAKRALDEKERELELLQKSTNAYIQNRGVLVRVINQLFEYKESLKLVNDEVKKGEGDERGRPRAMTQVVDIRLKNPKTGAITKEHNDKVLKDFIDLLQESLDNISKITPVEIAVTPTVLLTDWEKAWEENMPDIINTGANIVQEQFDSIRRAEIEAFDARIDATRDFYNEQIELAGDNERAKDQLRIKEDRAIKKLEKERADREKKAAKAGIVVSTALGIMKVFTESGLTFADKLIKAAIVAAAGASQLVAADRARYYAKGEIDIKGGTPGKDSIPAMLTPHESVMTAEETRASGGILKQIRAKKLNDKVLQEIMSGRSGGVAAAAFDDSRLLKKLDEVKNSQPDIIQRANLAYEVRKKGDNYKQIVRSKSFRK